MRIYENPSDTAKKVRVVLKNTFPSGKFAVVSQSESVEIHWTDGIQEHEVKQAVSWMESKKSEQHPDVGYVWEGATYCGAEYIFLRRSLSDKYKETILNYLKVNFAEDRKGYYTKLQWTEAESQYKASIDTGLCLVRNQASNEDSLCKKESNNGQTFHVKDGLCNIVRLADYQRSPISKENDLTPEQQFKYDLLSSLLETMPLPVEGALIREGHAIDDLFLKIAYGLYS